MREDFSKVAVKLLKVYVAVALVVH